MADKTLGITVTGDIDDISGKLDDLTGQLNQLESKTIDILLNTDTSAVENLDVSLEQVQEAAASANIDISSIDTTSLSEVSSVSQSASSGLEQISSSADSATKDIGNIKTESKQTGQEVSNSNKGITSSFNEINSAIQLVGGSAAALGGYLTINAWADAAGNFEDSWGRMAVAVGSTVNNVAAVKGEWSDAISTMSEATGRGGGVIREFITQMSIAGVTSEDAITSAFEGIAGAAYVAGDDINTLTYALQRAVRTGLLNQRTLTQLRLSTEDLEGYTHKSMDEISKDFENMSASERAAFLGSVYYKKYGTRANDAFKVSWQGVTEALSRAKGYLDIVIGKLILPMLIPAMEKTTSILKILAEGIDNLDPLSKGFLGTVLLLGGGFLTIMGTLVALVGVYNALQLKTILLTAAKWLEIDATNKSSIALAKEVAAKTVGMTREVAYSTAMYTSILARQIYNSAILASIGHYAKELLVKVAVTGANYAQAAATVAVTAAQYALNLAMSLNPIGLVVIAITALVAGLYLLYQNNEQVRNSINGLWTSLQGLGAWIQGGFMNVLSSMAAPFQQLYGEIVGFGQDLYRAGEQWIGNLIKGMEDSIPDIDDLLQSIADYFPHSPAKTGPLSEVTPDSMNSYGYDLGYGLGEGTKEGTDDSMSDKEFWDGVWRVGTSGVGLEAGVKGVLEITERERKRKDRKNDADEAAEQMRAMANMTVEDAQKAGISLDAWATGYKQLGDNTRLTYDSMANRGIEASRIQQQQLENLKQKAIESYNALKQAASDAYSTATSLLSAYGINVPGAKVSTSIVGANVTDAILKLTKQRDAVMTNPEMSWLERITQYNLLNDQIKNLQRYGYSAGSAYSAGLAAGISNGSTAVENAANMATLSLQAHSPPREGPLQEIDKWGENIGQTFIESMRDGISSISNILNVTQPAPLPSSTALGGGNVAYISFGDIKVTDGSNAKQVGNDLAAGINEGLDLNTQAINAGVNTINLRR